MKTYKDVVEEKIEEQPWFLATNLAWLRAKHNISMGKMSNACGISKAYISQLESGNHKRPSILIVKRLADFWDCRIEELCFTNLNKMD